MENEKLIESINNNINIMEKTFAAFDLKVSKCNIISIAESGEVEIGIEVEGTAENGSLPQDVSIKIVAYDDNDAIVGIEQAYLYESDFKGFDALWIYFNQEGIGFRMRSLKIFAQAN